MANNGYEHIVSGGGGFIARSRGLVSVEGTEAVQFLDGMITNDVKTLGDGTEMLAAFPNAQGRLLALVRIIRNGNRYFIETEDLTRAALYQNLFRFTFAGDFIVEDLSDSYRYFELFGDVSTNNMTDQVRFQTGRLQGAFVHVGEAADFTQHLSSAGIVEVTEDERQILRTEAGSPEYGLDVDDSTVVPEIGLDGLISYDKGCYIGQEIIARIHFRGHVAKRLTGLVFSESEITSNIDELALRTAEGKDAGKLTSIVYSPRLGKSIALGSVRYDHLAEGTELFADDHPVTVKDLPFVVY